MSTKKRTPGHPKKVGGRREHLAVYLEPADVAAVEFLAASEYMSASAWAARAIRRSLKETKP